MFGLKYPSLLQFDHSRQEEHIRANLTNLYGVERAPSDSQMREILDPVAPEALRPAFRQIHRELQRQKALAKYRYLGGYLLSVDGTGQFSSTALKCSECCSRTLRNGTEQYYHQLLAAVIVHPEQKTVLPRFPEAITRQDGESKNDCERNAAKRLLPAIRAAFPKLPLIVAYRPSRRECTPPTIAPRVANELHNCGQRDGPRLLEKRGRSTTEEWPGENDRTP
jgi:hypothetical protein